MADASVTVTTQVATYGFNTSIAIWDGNVPGGPVAACSHEPSTSFKVKASHTYMIEIGARDYPYTGGQLRVGLEVDQPPDNDDIASARPIALPGSSNPDSIFFDGSGATIGATTEDNEPTCGPYMGSSVWYRIASQPMAYDVLVELRAGGYPVTLAAYAQNAAGPSQLGCSVYGDPISFFDQTPQQIPNVRFRVSPNTAYLIQIGLTYHATTSSYYLVGQGAYLPPGDDQFDALPLTTARPGSQIFNTTPYHRSPWEEPLVPDRLWWDVTRTGWLRFTSATTGRIALVASATFPVALTAYSGEPATLQYMASSAVCTNMPNIVDTVCMDKIGVAGPEVAGPSTLTFVVRAGQTYFIAVGGRGGTSGPIRLTIHELD